jgi:hypothetical protein
MPFVLVKLRGLYLKRYVFLRNYQSYLIKKKQGAYEAITHLIEKHLTLQKYNKA